jgi:hypothetical protein
LTRRPGFAGSPENPRGRHNRMAKAGNAGRAFHQRSEIGAMRQFIRVSMLETRSLRRDRKRGLPGVAMAVRAMEKFAVLGVDSVGIAHSERAAATNHESNVVPGFWPIGTPARTMSPVARLQGGDGLPPAMAFVALPARRQPRRMPRWRRAQTKSGRHIRRARGQESATQPRRSV